MTGIIILKEAMTTFFHWIIKNGYFNKILLCNLVHDEAVIEFPKGMEFVEKELVKHMEAASQKYCKKLPIPAVAESGNCWIH